MTNFEIVMLSILIGVTLFVAMLIGYKRGFADGKMTGYRLGRSVKFNVSDKQ